MPKLAAGEGIDKGDPELAPAKKGGDMWNLGSISFPGRVADTPSFADRILGRRSADPRIVNVGGFRMGRTQAETMAAKPLPVQPDRFKSVLRGVPQGTN